jgi:hypothetical protein
VGDIDRLSSKIAQAAVRQQGNVTREQLLAIGMTSAAVGRWVKAGRLHRVHNGVYSLGRPPVTPHERASAAVLACGPGAVLSHGSAMTLWGFWRRWDTPFEVTVPGDRRPRGIRSHRSRSLHRREVRRHHGIPVTSPARTQLDMAARLKPGSLKRAIKDGQASKILSPDALAEVVHRHPHHPGAAKLRPYLEDRADTRSVLEDRFLAFCEGAGLPRPQTNVEVCGFLVDVLFPDQQVIVELDSWGFHANRESFEDDRERDGVTTEAGLVTVRITTRGFDQQTGRLLKILAARRRLHSPPS